MSVNNVNSLYKTQGVQGSTSYTTLSQDDGGGVDIGKLLLGGLGTVVTIGLGVAAYKSGKQSSLTKESDNVFTTMCNGVKNWLGKNGDDVANGVKKYVDLDDVNSLTDSQKIAKAQEVLEAAQHNLTVSNNKALKHMANIEDITSSLYKKGTDGKPTNTLIDKIDDTLFAKINGTKGLEGAFELAEDGKSLIIKDADIYNLYVNKRTTGWTTDINDKISLEDLKDLFNDTSQYYKTKQSNIAKDLDSLNSTFHNNFVLNSETANTILDFQELKQIINKKADYSSLADTHFYNENKELFLARAQKAGFSEQEANSFYNNNIFNIMKNIK